VVKQAARVKRNAPDLAKKVAAGTMSIGAADKAVKKREEDAAAAARSEEEKRAKAHRESIRRSVDGIRAFLASWPAVSHLRTDPSRLEILGELTAYDRDLFIKIETEHLK
jgi:hypothetical protein